MKFCENCGTQLEDNAVFCEECGTKQESIQESQSEVQAPESQATEAQPNVQTPKLSATCTPAKKQIAGWLLFVLLIVCSPWVLFEIIWALPDFLFWIVYFGSPIAMLILAWTKRTWKTWLKLAWTIAYAVMFFI